MKTPQHDLVVIGGGPAGYVGAIRAAQLGLDAACVDENGMLGGTCLRVGCIPSKALLESTGRLHEAEHELAEHGISAGGLKVDLSAMMKRKDDVVGKLCRGIESLFRRHHVTRYRGRARFDKPDLLSIDGGSDTSAVSAKHVLIATGSRPAGLPNLDMDGDRIGSSTEALSYDEVPERLVVIGAGYIGLEMGSVWSRLGAEVIVLEALDRILPGSDAELARQAKRALEKQGLEFHLGARVTGASKSGGRCTVQCEGMDDITCDRILVATGRSPRTDDLGLDSIGLETDEQGFIPVGEGYATAVGGVYAAGDCIGQPMLAHKASDEAVACVERLATGHGRVDYDAIPAVVYTHPEVAGVGRTEQSLQEEDVPYRKGASSFRANGRAWSLGTPDGMVKVLAHEKTDRVLGVHVIGPRAGDLIAEAATAIAFGASSEDIARSCHAHPTLAEALKEAALAVQNGAIHQ